MTIRLSMIGSESDADAYLKDLFTYENKRSITVVRVYAIHIKDKRLKKYFEKRGMEILMAYRES
jgi:hypothetical protein